MKVRKLPTFKQSKVEKDNCLVCLLQVEREIKRISILKRCYENKEIEHAQHQYKSWALISFRTLLKPDIIHFWQTKHVTLHKVSF